MIDAFLDGSLPTTARSALIVFVLVLARVVPVVELAPFLGGRATPRTVKTGIALAIALIVYPAVVTPDLLIAPPSDLALAALIVKEVLVGLTLGFVTSLVFESVRMAGQIVDAVRGQTMANVLVPQLPERASVTADYLYQLAIALFFVIGGHRLFLLAFTSSYQTITPLGYFSVDQATTTTFIVRVAADAIALGLSFALPAVAAILLADLMLGLVNKAAPQVNVFFLGMPAKAAIGIAVVLLSLGFWADRLAVEAAGVGDDIGELVARLGGVDGG